MNNKKITFGFVLACASTVLSLVCAILYKFVYLQTKGPFALLIVALLAGIAALALAIKLGKEIPNVCLIIHTVLVMAALGMSIAPMVNEIGLVYAGLNPQTNVTGFYTFAVFAGITWLIALVASFIGVSKKAE